MRRILVVISMICVGCAGLAQKMAERMGYTHKTLRVPTTTASEEERIAAYKALRLDKFSSVESNGYIQNTVTLADGTNIFYFSDLAQIVAADSETAIQAKLAEDKLLLSTKGGGRATLAFFGGILAFGGAAAGSTILIIEGKTSQGIAVGAAGIGVLALGIVPLVLYKLRYNKLSTLAHEAEENAAQTYNEDLLRQLNLCPDSKRVLFACEKQ